MKKLICIREILGIPIGGVCYYHNENNNSFINYINEDGYAVQLYSKFFRTFNVDPKSFFKLYDPLTTTTKLHISIME